MHCTAGLAAAHVHDLLHQVPSQCGTVTGKHPMELYISMLPGGYQVWCTPCRLHSIFCQLEA
jgi:hypothetical protein